MNRLKFKKQVIHLLATADIDTIRDELLSLPRKNLLNSLFSCLCHPSERVRWHAVSGFGLLVPAMAADDMEMARTAMRRFLWMLNDESGGIGWGVPEAMAEVMVHSRPLAEEYLHMLVSYTMDDGPELFQDGNFLELELLQEGVLWGLCRVAPLYRAELLGLGLGETIEVYLGSDNATVKGLACRLAGLLGLPHYLSLIGPARTDRRPVLIYERGAFTETSVAELAQAALNHL